MKKKAIILGAGIVALIISFIFDNTIISSVYSIRLDFLTAIMRTITNTWFILLFLLIISAFLYKKRRFLLLWLSCLSALVIIYVIKIIIPRTRPPIEQLIVMADSSFPSMHAAFLFAFIPIIIRYKPRLRCVWFAIILLITFSRLYLGVHYLSDIIAGALIGYIIGLLVIWLNKKYKLVK